MPRFYINFEQITEELDLHIQSKAQFLRRVTFVLNEFETCPTPPLPSERWFPWLKCSQMMRGLQTLAAACDRRLRSAQEEAARMIFLGVHDGS